MLKLAPIKGRHKSIFKTITSLYSFFIALRCSYFAYLRDFRRCRNRRRRENNDKDKNKRRLWQSKYCWGENLRQIYRTHSACSLCSLARASLGISVRLLASSLRKSSPYRPRKQSLDIEAILLASRNLDNTNIVASLCVTLPHKTTRI